MRREVHCAGAPAIELPFDQRRFNSRGRDDQHREAGEIGRRDLRFISILGGRQRQDGAKGRALAWRALDFDAAAHPLDDAPGDGQAETGAAEFSCRSAVGLLEFVEDASLLSWRNADAAVANLENDLSAVP